MRVQESEALPPPAPGVAGRRGIPHGAEAPTDPFGRASMPRTARKSPTERCRGQSLRNPTRTLRTIPRSATVVRRRNRGGSWGSGRAESWVSRGAGRSARRWRPLESGAGRHAQSAWDAPARTLDTGCSLPGLRRAAYNPRARVGSAPGGEPVANPLLRRDPAALDQPQGGAGPASSTYNPRARVGSAPGGEPVANPLLRRDPAASISLKEGRGRLPRQGPVAAAVRRGGGKAPAGREAPARPGRGEGVFSAWAAARATRSARDAAPVERSSVLATGF